MEPFKTLVLLTHQYPLATGEEFLIDEIDEIAPYFKEVIICPGNVKGTRKSIHRLPSNVRLAEWDNSLTEFRIERMVISIFPILVREYFRINSKKLFFSSFMYNLSLLKQCYLNALHLKKVIKNPNDTILYSYWCDDLAVTGTFCKSMLPDINFISRAHGFDVFEEQSDINYIFFRKFQLSQLDRLWAVSKAGSEHLKQMNTEYSHKIGYRYLGIKSEGSICFEETDIIRLVTCSHVRSIKRLELLIQTLKLVTDSIVEWHVIGDGPDLDLLKELSLELPVNCKAVFHGHLEIKNIQELYSKMHFDFLISLSSSEGLPVSMMEAISHGIPILATDVGGCREIVTGATGILVPVNFQYTELAQVIVNCKKGKFNNEAFRLSIVSFWKSNFNAIVNYRKFAEELNSIQ